MFKVCEFLLDITYITILLACSVNINDFDVSDTGGGWSLYAVIYLCGLVRLEIYVVNVQISQKVCNVCCQIKNVSSMYWYHTFVLRVTVARALCYIKSCSQSRILKGLVSNSYIGIIICISHHPN